MIQIVKVADELQAFLSGASIEKYKIFVRINFTIDTVVVVSDDELSRNLMDEFYMFVADKDLLSDVKIKIKTISVEESEDPFNSNLFVGGENCIDWGPRYRFDSLLKSDSAAKGQTSIPIVTFYSYKGGMGRTTTMVAAAMDMAINKGKRVVIIDCDLEAPGYLNFFDLSEHIGLREGKTNGLVEFLADTQFSTNPDNIDINNYMINVGLGNENKASFDNLDNIWLVPAGNLNESYLDIEQVSDRSSYLEGLSRINLSKVSSIVDSFNLLFSKIQEVVKPDIIFLDSRTGFNDIFGTAAFYLSTCVVGFFGFNRQTQPGLMNLLEEYYKKQNNFKLHLVFSILPLKADDKWINYHKAKIEEYISSLETSDRDHPSYLYLHRNEVLEKIGTGDERSDEEFIDLVRNEKFGDYSELFDMLYDLFPKKVIPEMEITSETPALVLRNVVLKQLKIALENVKNFAEDTTIVEEQFFYRECMKQLFQSDKFLIQGYKGTGKTYLYRALADKQISTKIQEWAKVPSGQTQESIFINILPKRENDPDDKGYPFASIRYSEIEEYEYYFNCFWQIYTWNKILLCPEFEDIKLSSELRDYIVNIDGNKTVKLFNELIDKGVDTLIVIENDMNKINDYLKRSNKKLFVLYDRLDTCINPLRWNKAVSPLINFWRDNNTSFSNIYPKIFVRTDLFRQIEGTNKMRLNDNIISIEWTIGEVFGYFFKLIFSDKKASEAYWAIANKVGIKDDFIKNTKLSFTKAPKNQFKSFTKAEMQPLIQIFFGREVKVGYVSLSSPWDYFSKELANADNSAISLRPFINTMSGNAIDKALAKTEKFVHEIISSEIYASKEVREKTTESYFDDLTQDAFSKDLQKLKEVIRTAGGEQYRYKSLTEKQFADLLNETFEKIIDSPVVKTPEDLKMLITANGIMAEKITTKGRYYSFAPIYHYSWGLANSALEKEKEKEKEAKKAKRSEPKETEQQETKSKPVRSIGILHIDRYAKPYITIDGSFFKYEARGLDKSFVDEDRVSFIIGLEPKPTPWNPNAKFSYAYDIKLED